MNIMIAVAVADCKLYIIDEFLRRVEAEMPELDKLGDWHMLVYGDRLDRDGYVWKRLNTWVKKHKDKVTYLPGGELMRMKDNIYNSGIVSQVRQQLREVALCSDWWDAVLFWDVDVIPAAGAVAKLVEDMTDDYGIMSALVADWLSGNVSVATFDDSDDDMRVVFFAEELKPCSVYSVGVTHLAFTLVRRDVLQDVPFLTDENTLVWGDDGYFCRLAYRQHYRIGLSSAVGALHVHESLKGVLTEVRRGAVLTRTVPKVPVTVIGDVGKEPAIVYVRDDSGGRFPAPIDWTFRRGEPVPERLLGEKRIEILMQGSAFRRVVVPRKDVEVAVDLF